MGPSDALVGRRRRLAPAAPLAEAHASSSASRTPRRRLAAIAAHDVVLFGATGYTGALTAEYLARQAPPQTRWALAGRNRAKLEALRERLGVDVPLLHADVEDPRSLREVADAARVVITTVGPYIRYGEPLVAACAEAGTGYVDLTGEPEFVDRMYVRHHARAAATGARIVHACGFDCIPADLGTLLTVEALPEGVPLRVEGFVRAGGMPSGGSFHTAVTAFSRVRQMARAHSERRRAEPAPDGRQVRAVRPAPRRERAVDAWVLPFPSLDPQVVAASARSLERYGPDFAYGHYLAIKRLPVAAGLVAGAASVFALAQVPPARSLMLGRLSPGEGPSPEQRDRGWFEVRLVGEGGGRRVVTRVAGGDPGYGETSKMLAESALCLAHDDLPSTAGQVTTAVAMGGALTERLRRAGLTFSAIETMEV